MSTVLVTGAAGSIGSELVRQHAEAGDRVILFDNREPDCFDLYERLRLDGHGVECVIGDVRDERHLKAAFGHGPIDLVYHAAAYKCVTPMERQPRQSVEVNVVGSLNVMAAAAMHGDPRLVFISTDKAAKAECVMGASKRLVEAMAKRFGNVVVRFGNVMNSNGSVLPLWRGQIEAGKPLTVTDRRCRRYLMTIPEAVALVRKAAECAEPGETWVMDMGEPVSIMDMAYRLLDEMGRVPATYPIREIGLRDGEVLEEMLMTYDEARRAVKKSGFYVWK